MNDVNFFPELSDLLKSGVQFGHEKSRWNPKMAKYIFGIKNGIHVLNVESTYEKLKTAYDFLKEVASKGNVLFVGTKKQASDIIKDEAIRSGSFFVTNRWAGGLFTNFNMIKQSLAKLQSLEKQFEEGVQGRTKYEVALMKKEWQSLTRLYAGIKTLVTKPVAIVVLDTKFERAAVREARKVGIPVIGIVDTNSNPDSADYVIPANDDALNSIRLLFRTLGNAVLDGNKGNGIKHELKDYSKEDIKITKAIEVEEVAERVSVDNIESEETTRTVKEIASKPMKSTSKAKGILERAKEEATVKPAPVAEAKKAPAAKVEKEVAKAKPAAKTAKPVAEKEAKPKAKAKK